MSAVLLHVNNQNREMPSRPKPPIEEPEPQNPEPVEDPQDDPADPGHEDTPEELPTSPE